MKKSYSLYWLASLFFLFSNSSHAIVLELSPSQSYAQTSDLISIDLVISELGASGAPSLGFFDVDIAFDTNTLTFNGYTIGDKLGSLDLFEADDWSMGYLGGGIINLAELSYLFPFELHALQSDSISLLSLDFMVASILPNDETTISIELVNAIADQDGIDLTNITTQNAVITGTSIPEPSILLLFGLGFLSLRFQQRIKNTSPVFSKEISA